MLNVPSVSDLQKVFRKSGIKHLKDTYAQGMRICVFFDPDTNEAVSAQTYFNGDEPVSSSHMASLYGCKNLRDVHEHLYDLITYSENGEY